MRRYHNIVQRSTSQRIIMKLSSISLHIFLICSSLRVSAFTSKVSQSTVPYRILKNTPTCISAYIGQEFDETPSSPFDDNNKDSLDTNKYVQSMSPEERTENLKVMRQIFNHDLADLQRRRDYAGKLS